jgi:two-component system CheB/CheR fusion protein
MRQSADSSRLRVLVVDDDVDGANSLCLLLEAMGCEAAACSDGPEGLGFAVRFAPQLAIIDLDMPRMRGCEMVRHLRLQESPDLAMVVCLTGFPRPDVRQPGAGAGFDCHVMKPISSATLSDILERTRRLASPSPSLS